MTPLHDEARRVIAEGCAADASPLGSRDRNWRALSSRLDAPLPPGAAAADCALDALHGAASWSSALLKFVLLGTVLGSGLLLHPGSGSDRGSVGTATTQLRPFDPAAAGATSAAPPAPVLGRQREAAAPNAPPSKRGEAPARVATGVSAPRRVTSSMLGAETRLIARAQSALNEGAALSALALLERHRREFPGGALVPEREAARVIALCALGHEAEAKAARVRFERSWSSSPLLARVRASCASTGK